MTDRSSVRRRILDTPSVSEACALAAGAAFASSKAARAALDAGDLDTVRRELDFIFDTGVDLQSHPDIMRMIHEDGGARLQGPVPSDLPRWIQRLLRRR